jgi:hypothetical protein
MSYPPNPPDQATRQLIDTLTWYHTIDLGHGNYSRPPLAVLQ